MSSKLDKRTALGKNTMVTKQGIMKRAGAKLPDEVGGGGRADITLANIATPEGVINKTIDRSNVLKKLVGFDSSKQIEANDAIKETLESLHEAGANKDSLVIWMKAIRENKNNTIELLENSFGSDLQKAVELIAKKDGKEVKCNVYPVFLYHQAGFPENIDMIVDVDFEENNKFVDPIFRSFRVVAQWDEKEPFVDHSAEVHKGTDYTVQLLDNQDDNYHNLLRGIAERVLEDAKQKYNQLYPRKRTDYKKPNYGPPIRFNDDGSIE